MTIRFYGKVLEIKEHKGSLFAKAISLNQDAKEFVIVAVDNKFGGSDLVADSIFSADLSPIGKGTIMQVSRFIKSYNNGYSTNSNFKTHGKVSRQDSITYGNMVNVARALNNKAKSPDFEKTFDLADSLFSKCAIIREELFSDFPDHDKNDIGAKLGDTLKHVATFFKEDQIKEMLSSAKRMVSTHIERETQFFSQNGC